MAIVNSVLDFSGKLGFLTAYKRDGKVILRRGSGPSKKKIMESPDFVRVRNT